MVCRRMSHLAMDRDRRDVSGDFGVVRFVGFVEIVKRGRREWTRRSLVDFVAGRGLYIRQRVADGRAAVGI